MLLFTYALGLVPSVTGAVQSLMSVRNGVHATNSTDSVAAKLINDVVPLLVGLFAAVLGMRTAAGRHRT